MSSGVNNRRRGFGYEREVVHLFRRAGFESFRTWGSDGRSRGLPEDVDVGVEIGPRIKTFQLKRKKSLAAYLKPSEHNTGVIVREDRGESYIVMRLADYINLLSHAEGVTPVPDGAVHNGQDEPQ